MAPEVVTSDVLKPRRAPQSPCQGSIYGCLLAGAYLRVATAWSPTARAWPAELPESCRWPATPDGRVRVYATASCEISPRERQVSDETIEGERTGSRPTAVLQVARLDARKLSLSPPLARIFHAPL
jgi:hypothetical protein